MFNKKQIDDVIKNNRDDVAADMYEQIERLADEEEKKKNFTKMQA